MISLEQSSPEHINNCTKKPSKNWAVNYIKRIVNQSFTCKASLSSIVLGFGLHTILPDCES